MVIVEADENAATGHARFHKIRRPGDSDSDAVPPRRDMERRIRALRMNHGLSENGVYREFVGATLTAKAFDSVQPGLGKWLITVGFLGVRGLHHYCLGVLRRAGHHLHRWGPGCTAVPPSLLRGDVRRHAWPHQVECRPRQPERHRIGCHHLRQFADLVDLRLSSDARVQVVHRASEKRGHDLRHPHRRSALM